MKTRGRWLETPWKRGGLLVWSFTGLAAAGCANLDETASPDTVMQLTVSPRSLPADGFSTATVVAEIDPRTSERYRDVSFSTTLGSFVGAGGRGVTSIVVPADAEGRAVATLRSGTQFGTAVVTAEIRDGDAVKMARTLEIPFESIPASDVIVLEMGSVVAPADGATVTPVVARVASGVLLAQRTVSFTTTLGTLGSSGARVADVLAGADAVASVGLVSPRETGVAVVTATINNLTARGSVQFEPAAADSMSLSVLGSLRLQATFATKVSLEVELFRQVGSVTRGTEVAFRAFDDSTQNQFGFFSGINPSDSLGKVTAEFTPGNTTERGEATIRARVVGTDVSAHVKIEIIDPPKTP